MGDIVKLIKEFLKPSAGWGPFWRKNISVLFLAVLFSVGFRQYQSYQQVQFYELSAHEVINRYPEIKNQVADYINVLLRGDIGVRSVWIYGWHDARTLTPAVFAGDNQNPMPSNYFWATDATAVGQLALGGCSVIDRPTNIYACPLVVENDSWGLMVVEFEQGVDPSEYKNSIRGIAHRVAQIIYHPHY